MSADGKIYITISDERGSGNFGGNGKSGGEIKYKTDEEKQKLFLKHQFFNFIESEAKQMASYTLNNIGNFTGDYNTQRQVNYASSVASKVYGLGIAAIAGGITGFAFALASQTINFGLQLRSENIAVNKQNYEIRQLKQISGLDGLTNGSRI